MNLKSLSFLLSFLFIYIATDARHIVGGDIEVSASNIDGDNFITYNVTLNMYRDCFQGGIPEPTGFGDSMENQEATIGIYRRENGRWVFERRLVIQREFRNGEMIDPGDNPCIEPPPGLCVDRNEYKFTTDLEIINDSYLISYQRCCRNETITNIIDPGDQGIAYTYEITAVSQSLVNSSPQFKNFPPILICADEPFQFDHGAIDLDGDELVYEFCNPLTAGGDDIFNATACDGTTPSPSNCLPPFDNVVFRRPNFTADNPLPGTVDFTIDSETGLITGTPSLLGQYVIGICVKEFRNGILLSEVRRDIQFNVSLCKKSKPLLAQFGMELEPEIQGRDTTIFIEVCGKNLVLEDRSEFFFSEGNNNKDTVSRWEFFDIGGREIDTLVNNRESYQVNFPGEGIYRGRFTSNANDVCGKPVNLNVKVFPQTMADFTSDYDSCIAGPIEFDASLSRTDAMIIRSYEWNYGNGLTGEGKNTLIQPDSAGRRDVTLFVTDNNECVDSITKEIDWSPVPQLIVVEPSTFRGCLPASVFFDNLTTPINEEYDIRWDFGDGNTSDEISPTHIYETEGVYSVGVRIVSPLNCEIERTFNSWIRVEEKPTAAFSFTPPFPNAFNRTVQFTDESIEAIAWQWNFSNEGSAFEPDPNYTFPDTGFQTIELVVRHVSGCTDTATQIIDIRPESTFFMPNAFTPNTDATNDVFKGIGFTEGISNFEMSIWSRWGEQVFRTEDPLEGWNGRKNNTGQELPNGVYVYLVTYDDPRSRPQKLKGFATLIR